MKMILMSDNLTHMRYLRERKKRKYIERKYYLVVFSCVIYICGGISRIKRNLLKLLEYDCRYC